MCIYVHPTLTLSHSESPSLSIMQAGNGIKSTACSVSGFSLSFHNIKHVFIFQLSFKALTQFWCTISTLFAGSHFDAELRLLAPKNKRTIFNMFQWLVSSWFWAVRGPKTEAAWSLSHPLPHLLQLTENMGCKSTQEAASCSQSKRQAWLALMTFK